MQFSKNKKILAALVVLGVFGIVSTSSALELSWPTSPGGKELSDDSAISDLVQYLYEWGIALGGLATFTALVVAGFDYLTSAGNTEKMSNARKRINSSLLGLVLLLSSWLILNTINPELTSFQVPSFDIKDMPPVSGTSFQVQPPCDEVELYKDPDWQGKLIGTLSKTVTGIDTYSAGYPMSAKAFYFKDSGEQHCNYGLDIATGTDTCAGEITCDYGETRCESGPAGGGCFLQITIHNVLQGCPGDTIAYIPATDADFYNYGVTQEDEFTVARCVYINFPRR